MCKALSGSHGSFCPSLSKVEALLGDGLGHCSRFVARHFRNLAAESYVTHYAEMVVFHLWASDTALSADWGTIGVAWVVRDLLWNASYACPQRIKQLVESWANRKPHFGRDVH